MNRYTKEVTSFGDNDGRKIYVGQIYTHPDVPSYHLEVMRIAIYETNSQKATISIRYLDATDHTNVAFDTDDYLWFRWEINKWSPIEEGDE